MSPTSSPPGTGLPPGLRARVLADAAKSPPRGSFRHHAVAAVTASAIWLGTMLVVKGVRRDWVELPVWYTQGTIAALVLVAGALSFVGLSRGRHMLGVRAETLIALTSAMPVVVAAWASLVVASAPSSAPCPTWMAALEHAPACDAMSMVLAAPVLAAFLWQKRGLAPANPGLTGACLGAAAAAWAHLVVHAICPYGHAAHALVGHALPMLPLMGLGAWLGRRVL